MQINFNELQFIVGNADVVDRMPSAKPLQPFSSEAISFLNMLSKKILSMGKEFSDVVTFGFWCRRAALLKEKENYDDISERLGRGIVFHSTPSNVPVNFAFSFAAGLLAGNANIVRLPAKNFVQVTVICDAINELINGECAAMAQYICMVKYPPIKEITDAFSSLCDSRIVWGGDNTITEIRQSPLKARANEITFADRHSIAIINSDEYLKANNKEKIRSDFYNDTYFSDQNACTSPRIVFWLGDKKEIAKEEFWSGIHKLVKEKYTLASVQAVGKLTAFYRVAQKYNVKLIKSEDCLVTRVAVKSFDGSIMDYKYNSGFFYEYDINSLKEILPVCTKRCQTITYFGISEDEFRAFITECTPCGIDRIIPMGKSMDFNLVWDGYDLIRSLSRKISVI